MPKIPPRLEVLENPLYHLAMAAQHAAYQLIREMPPDQKAAATRLHAALVHATTYVTFAVDPGATDKDAARRGIGAAAAEAKELLEPLSRFADGGVVESLGAKLDDLVKAGSPTPASSFPG